MMRRFENRQFACLRLMLAIWSLFLLTSAATAAQLAWDPSPDSSVVGYIVHVGQSSGVYTTRIDVGASTAHSITNLPAGSTNYFAVTAYNAARAESVYSNEASATEGSAAPVAAFSASATSGPAPLAINFTSASTGSITSYAWTFGDGTSSTSQNPAKLYSSPGIYTVSLKVTGPGGSNTLTKSSYITASPSADTIAPSMTPGLTAAALTGGSIKVFWAAATDNVGVVGYRLERCQGTCPAFTEIAAITVMSYTDSGLASGTTYRYRVRAVDAAGNLGGYSVVGSAKTSGVDATPPTAPGIPVVLSGSSKASLRWAAATDNVAVTGYRVERCQGTGCTTFTQIASPNGTKYNDNGVSLGANAYRYRVRAVDAAGNLGPYSPIQTIGTISAGSTIAFGELKHATGPAKSSRDGGELPER